MAVLTALLMTVAFASAASAHPGTAQNGGPHDDAEGDWSGTATTAESDHAATHPGSSTVDSVDNDTPADAVNVIRDYGLENAPIIIGVIGAIFLVGLTFYLVRRGLMKARGAMRL